MKKRIPTSTVNIHEAKTQFSRLLKRVAAGQEIVIARAGHPVARLIPFRQPGTRELGMDAGRVKIAEDFDAPLPEAILADFDR
jgi:prevent-host-death family protein